MNANIDYFYQYNESDKAKEIYAQFGLCVYTFQVLEHQLMNMLLVKAKAENLDMKSEEYDSVFYSYSDKTMGKLIEKILSLFDIPTDKKKKLWNLHSKRNYFVHHYFKDHSEYFYSECKQVEMFKEIIETIEEIQEMDSFLEDLTQPVINKINIDEKYFEYWYGKLKNGEDISSLKFKKD